MDPPPPPLRLSETVANDSMGPPPTSQNVIDFMVGMLVAASMYAIFLTLFIITLWTISKPRRKLLIYHLFYAIVLWLVYTINITSLFSTDASLILCTLKDQNRLIACKLKLIGNAAQLARLHVTGISTMIIAVHADLLTIWRAWTLWQRRWILVVPSLTMLMVAISLFIWATVIPNDAPPQLAFATNSVFSAVDLLTTSLIITRLTILWRSSNRLLGKDHTAQYKTLISIFVESSALTATGRITNAIVQFTSTGGERSWGPSLSNGCSGIASLLIILRLTLNIAFDGKSLRSKIRNNLRTPGHNTNNNNNTHPILNLKTRSRFVGYPVRSQVDNNGAFTSVIIDLSFVEGGDGKPDTKVIDIGRASYERDPNEEEDDNAGWLHPQPESAFDGHFTPGDTIQLVRLDRSPVVRQEQV